MTASDDAQRSRAARRWWEMLQSDRYGRPNSFGDPAALAKLRRSATPIDALKEPSVFELYEKLGFDRYDLEKWLPRVAVVAIVLAQIRKDAELENGFRRVFAEQLGQGKEGRLMSPLRFKRLLAAIEDQELLTAFRRAVALAHATNIDVGDVAVSMLDWSERRRMRWAFDYFGAGSAAPRTGETVSAGNEE